MAITPIYNNLPDTEQLPLPNNPANLTDVGNAHKRLLTIRKNRMDERRVDVHEDYEWDMRVCRTAVEVAVANNRYGGILGAVDTVARENIQQVASTKLDIRDFDGKLVQALEQPAMSAQLQEAVQGALASALNPDTPPARFLQPLLDATMAKFQVAWQQQLADTITTALAPLNGSIHALEGSVQQLEIAIRKSSILSTKNHNSSQHRGPFESVPTPAPPHLHLDEMGLPPITSVDMVNGLDGAMLIQIFRAYFPGEAVPRSLSHRRKRILLAVGCHAASM